MDLIELPKARLRIGMTLNFTSRDEVGAVLLGKGNRIDSLRQLQSILDRKRIFVQIEPLVASVMNRKNQPITGPRRCSTSSKDTAIKSSLIASAVKINFKTAPLLRLIPR